MKNPSQSYAEFDSEYIKNCCENYLIHFKERTSKDLEELIQNQMSKYKFRGFFKKKSKFTREEAIQELKYTDSHKWFSEWNMVADRGISYKYKVEELLKLCSSPINKIHLNSEMSFLLDFYDDSIKE